jgi:hypothetical protein
MHANRILLPLLILTSLTVDLVLVGWLSQHSVWPDTSLAVILGLAAGQINLATLWGVLGHQHVPWRIAALLVVPLGWSWAIVASAPHVLVGYGTAAAWGAHFLTQTALLASILTPIRLAGARMMSEELAPSDRPARRLQFTLRYLFAWLTATAVALSALKATFQDVKVAQVALPWDHVLGLCFVSAMLGLTCVWLVLDTRDLSTRLKTALVTALPAACAAIGGSFFLATDPNRLFAAILLWLVAGFYSAMALLVLGVAGFRLVWVNGGAVITVIR